MTGCHFATAGSISSPLPHFLDWLSVVRLYNKLTKSVDECSDNGLVYLEDGRNYVSLSLLN